MQLLRGNDVTLRTFGGTFLILLLAGYQYIPYAATGRFPQLVTDYLAGRLRETALYAFEPALCGIAEAIKARNVPVDRALLQQTIRSQYSGFALSEAAEKSIDALHHEKTFTVCTAHQPNLATGYLYFIYKILHAVKLAQRLAAEHPGYNFVPVFYIGSEDADLEELGVFSYAGKAYRWDGSGQAGAVGRMATGGLKPLLDELFRVLGPPGANRDALEDLLRVAYGGKYTVAGATRYIINALMGHYGLLVIDGDDAALKATFRAVMQDELLHGTSHGLLEKGTEILSGDYKVQATGRDINLFYLRAGLRARIEKQGEHWNIPGAEISWDKNEMLAELNDHPDRFSPNVVLRPLYQETILPNVAFIGGGAEVSYWLQLRAVFDHYGVFYPVVLLRQSVWYLDKDMQRRLAQLGLTPADVFKPAHILRDEVLRRFAPAGWETDAERKMVADALMAVESKAEALSSTLPKAVKSTAARIARLLARLDQKMLRSHRAALAVHTARLDKVLRGALPGGSLQERVENFISYYPEGGPSWFDAVLAGIRTDDASFLIVEQ